MEWMQAFWLAIVQGLTEFLPVSSSAHLILLPVIAGWPDQGLAFDVAVHVGTLAAVMLYFRESLAAMARDCLTGVRERRLGGEARLAWLVVLATVPVVIGGFLLQDLAETVFRSPLVIAAATIVFGLVLWLSVRYAGPRQEGELRVSDALIIGLSQVLAIIPGTSRSGITMTAGLFLGLTPAAAARFSFLLSIPTIGLAGAWKALSLLQQLQGVNWGQIGFGILVSGLSAYACIGAFLALLERIGMAPFVIYRLALGVVLLLVFI
jgi:undecaprenyl-diphosphatase